MPASPLGFLGKALTKLAVKTVKSTVRKTGKTIESQAPRNTTAGTKSVASRIATSPSVRRVEPVQVPITRATTPTRLSFTQAATPNRVPRTMPGETVTPGGIIVPSTGARNVRSVASIEENIATRKATEDLIRKQADDAARANAFGQPSRLRPETPAPSTPQVPAAQTRVQAAVEEPPFPPKVQGAVEEPPTRRRFPLRAALEVAGASAPQITDRIENAPDWLKTTANIAGILAGGSLAQRGFSKTGPLSSATRSAFSAANKRGKAGIIAKTTLPPALGAITLTSIANPFPSGGGPTTPPVSALPTEDEQATVLPPLGGTPETPGFGTTAEQDVQAAIDAAIANISSGTGTADDAATIATGEKSALDQGVSDAMAALEAAYGGPAAADAAIAAGDPILLQQLAGIEADYQAGLGQIQANYAGALAQVQGYQSQADQLLQETAAAQMAGFGAAAGGLEALSPGTGMTGAQAAAAGISDTALGGAGITGAALSRGLAGAASVQAAADRLRLGTDLSGQLATGRLTQADLEAGLARAAVGEKAVARTESAKRESAARELAKQQKNENAVRIAELKYQAALDKQAEATRKSENTAAQKQRIAELKMNAELELAMKVAAMTPAERAAYKGSVAGSKSFKAPSWYGKRDSRDPNKGLPIDVPSKTNVTVATVARAHDQLDYQMQLPESQDPTTAFGVWADFFDKAGPDARAIYAATGRPQSAGEMLKQIFNTPKK